MDDKVEAEQKIAVIAFTPLYTGNVGLPMVLELWGTFLVT